MNPYIKLLRPNVCLLAVFALIVGSVVAHALVFNLLYAIIAVFLISGAGNVINDYFDVETDKINKPHRPIASGEISRRNALLYFFILCIFGLIFASLVSFDFFILALINEAVLFLYSWKLKPVALLGNLAVAYLASSSFLAGGLILGSFSELLGSAVLVLFLVSFLGTTSREILKDIEDVEGDKKLGMKTLPILMGEKKSKIVAYAILLLACVSLILPISLLNIFYIPLAIIGVIICLYAIASHNNITRAQKLVKIAMFVIMFGFLVGAAT